MTRGDERKNMGELKRVEKAGESKKVFLLIFETIQPNSATAIIVA